MSFAAVCTCGLHLHTALRSEAVPDQIHAHNPLLWLLKMLLLLYAVYSPPPPFPKYCGACLACDASLP